MSTTDQDAALENLIALNRRTGNWAMVARLREKQEAIKQARVAASLASAKRKTESQPPEDLWTKYESILRGTK